MIGRLVLALMPEHVELHLSEFARCLENDERKGLSDLLGKIRPVVNTRSDCVST